MMMRSFVTLALVLPAASLSIHAAEPAPPAPPLTRPAMKQALEDRKRALPRLPLPPLSDKEKVERDDRSIVNNGRMRQLYLPEELRGGDFFRGRDPVMTLDPTFKTMLFWIVSRVNNCYY